MRFRVLRQCIVVEQAVVVAETAEEAKLKAEHNAKVIGRSEPLEWQETERHEFVLQVEPQKII